MYDRIKREIGRINVGAADGVAFVGGELHVGEAMAPPLVRAAKRAAKKSASPDTNEGGLVIVDSPPGTSCPMVEAVRGADLVLLVTEPTPFGLNDLAMAVDTVRQLRLPFAVVVNRSGLGDGALCDHCDEEEIEILAELPDDRRVAEAYSRGELAALALPEFGERFRELLGRVSLPASRSSAPDGSTGLLRRSGSGCEGRELAEVRAARREPRPPTAAASGSAGAQ